MESIKKIDELVSWYQKNYSVATIDQLHECKTRLLTYGYNVAHELADVNRTVLLLENEKKTTEIKSKISLINDGKSVAMSESISKGLIVEIMADYVEYKSVYDRIKILHEQSRAICDDITQRIAILRKEKEDKL